MKLKNLNDVINLSFNYYIRQDIGRDLAVKAGFADDSEEKCTI